MSDTHQQSPNPARSLTAGCRTKRLERRLAAGFHRDFLGKAECNSALRFLHAHVQPFCPAPHTARAAVLLLFLAVNAVWGAPVKLLPQVIALPANAGEPLFVDIEGNGRCNLLVIDTVEKKLLNYRQRPDGFGSSPDQVIPLPPQTAWVAPCDVDAHPGLELLMSTATGLVYWLQNAGLFESERHPLIEVSQAFTNIAFPTLTLLTTNQAGTNDLIPVISAGQAVLYHRNNAYEWSAGPPMTLDAKQTAWSVNRDEWMMGPNPAHSLRVQQSFRAKAEREPDKEPGNEAIRKIIAGMKTNAAASPSYMERVDVDGDGREDLVLWQASVKLDLRTDLYIFLRGAGQPLPERPTQILHCPGIPIPISSTRELSPVHDLSGDGVCELVLLEPKTPSSYSGLLETVLSHGLDCALTIRSFHRGAFSRSPDASVPVTILLADWDKLGSWPICIQGDFNGDGRPDLLVRRSETQWNIFCSTTDGRRFAPQPAMTFDTPVRGWYEIKDLNGAGVADLICHEPDEQRLSIFMSPFQQAKGKKP